MGRFAQYASSSTSRFGTDDRFGTGKKAERKTIDTSSIESLKAEAEKRGLDVKEKKPSLFRRTLDVISRPLYTTAGAVKAVIKGENVAQEAWKGFTGKEKETFSDVLGEVGVENKYVRGGLGFVLDVALDPTTYFGGAAIKGAGKVAKFGAKPIGKAVQKVAPTQAKYLTAAGQNLKDAFGSAFKFGYGTTKGLADDVGRVLNKVGMAKEDVIDDVVGAFGKKVNPKKVERATDLFINNRRVERGFEKGKIKYAQDPETNKILNIMKKQGQKIGKEAGIDKPDKWYFPFLKKTEKAKIGEAGKVLDVSKEGYYKEFRNLIKDEELLKKPIEAYSRRQFQVVRDKMVKGTMQDMVGAYGKPLKAFKTADEAAEAGYKLIKDRAFGKQVGYLKDTDAKFINDYLFPEFKSIDMLAKASGYDQFTRWFKQAVTSWFPAFHIRNYLSGNVQNYQAIGTQAFNPKNHNTALGILKGVDRDVTLGKNVYNLKDLNKVVRENFSGASRYISDIGHHIDETMLNKFTINKIKDPGRIVGNFIETNQKAVAMAGALRQGKNIDEAVKIAEQAGFDYGKITKFESKIMRRLVPFYTFARKNAGLQARTLVKNPERILNQAKAANAVSNMIGGKVTEEDLKGVPSWALAGLGFKVKGNKYVAQFGLPMEEFIGRINEPLVSTLSSLNPIVKYPLEAKLGFDFFREQKITDINKVAPATGEMLINAKEKGIMPEWLDNALNIKAYEHDGKTKYSMSPKALHILRNIPTSRFQNTLEKIFDKDMDKVNKYMAFFSGGRIYDIDIEQQKYFEERDLRRDIEDQLLERGVGSKFENFYIYKD